jgi:hypothetical protein
MVKTVIAVAAGTLLAQHIGRAVWGGLGSAKATAWGLVPGARAAQYAAVHRRVATVVR